MLKVPVLQAEVRQTAHGSPVCLCLDRHPDHLHRELAHKVSIDMLHPRDRTALVPSGALMQFQHGARQRRQAVVWGQSHLRQQIGSIPMQLYPKEWFQIDRCRMSQQIISLFGSILADSRNHPHSLGARQSGMEVLKVFENADHGVEQTEAAGFSHQQTIPLSLTIWSLPLLTVQLVDDANTCGRSQAWLIRMRTTALALQAQREDRLDHQERRTQF